MAATAGESADALPVPLPPRVAAPAYTLAGVGVTGGVRTGVLSDGSTVHLVTVGRTVGGYAVVAVADDSVTLADAAGERFVIRLR
jgi:hypothetical protein